MGEFRVHGLEDEIYQVYEYPSAEKANLGVDGEFRHQGSMADCYAYIMLRDRGAL